MKRFFIALSAIVFVAQIAFAEVKEVTNSFPYYEYVVSVEGTPSELKNKVINWSKTTYDRTEFIVKDDAESVTIDGNSWISKGEMGVCPVTFHFTLKFQFKDGRFKCIAQATKAMVQDGMLPRYLDQFKKYCARPTNSARRDKEIEIFHQKLLTWMEDASKATSEQPESDW